jgi:hypothetical protein
MEQAILEFRVQGSEASKFQGRNLISISQFMDRGMPEFLYNQEDFQHGRPVKGMPTSAPPRHPALLTLHWSSRLGVQPYPGKFWLGRGEEIWRLLYSGRKARLFRNRARPGSDPIWRKRTPALHAQACNRPSKL